jgi:hypothetical protein
LAQKEFHDIITWMPHGRSWKVLKPNLFESMVMPLFFEYSNYHSFNRLVNAWSFRRISSGPDRGSYYHELFLRGKPYLQKYMRRLPKTHKKLPMKKEDEPDFYKMDKENPLPPLEEIPLSASKMRGGHHQALSPVGGVGINGMGMQRHRMYPEGPIGSQHQQQQDAYGDDGYGMAVGRGQSRSPVGGSSPGSMRDPANFKNMEFKPVPNGAMGMNGMGMDGCGSGMMGPHMGNGMMNGQMGPSPMMNGQMGPGQMMNGMSNMGMNGMNGMNNMGMMNGGMGNGMMGMNPNMMMGMNPMMQQQSQQQQMNGYGGMQMGGMGQMGNGMMNGPMMNGQMMGPQNMNMQRLRAHQMQFAGMPVGAGGDEGYGRMGSFHPQC